MHYFPVSLAALLFFIFLLIFLVLLIEVRVFSYAYTLMGINRRCIFLLLLVSLIGTYFNVPVYQFPTGQVISDAHIDFFGMRYIVPMVRQRQGTTIAVNIGGAVVPMLLSLYLLVKNKFYGKALAGIILVTIVVHMVAYPVKGLGIAEPLFVPPLAAAASLIFARDSAPTLAYISGTLGTLIGADLLNLDKAQALEAPIMSIGGAGTFDGIFLTGIVAVLMAAVLARRHRTAESRD
ncbi:MAG TPA: DUF1614 domain-containing protein [Syntrophobacteraceae bacterium]|nr:DUF1614 domain-containing protein [Syntrophobacteraceae bacterium]